MWISPKMPATIHCVRHARGQHNLGPPYQDSIDPALTTLGRDQYVELCSSGFIDHANISLVAASPMFWTLETAFIVFGPALNDRCGGRILALRNAQEVSDYHSNTGSDPTILRERCSLHNLPVDLSRVSDGWNTKPSGSRYFPSRDALESRARHCRKQLYKLVSRLKESGIQDLEIAVVSHGGFLHFLTEDWQNASVFNGSGWENGENVRSRKSNFYSRILGS